jgi:hypothetical protein
MRLDIKRATIIGLLSNDFFVRGPKMVWQPLSKAHRLLFGKGPGIGPYRVRYLDLYARGCKILPMPCIPDNLCRDLRIGCIPSGKILSSFVQNYSTSLTTSRIISKKGDSLGHATLSGKRENGPPPPEVSTGRCGLGQGY